MPLHIKLNATLGEHDREFQLFLDVFGEVPLWLLERCQRDIAPVQDVLQNVQIALGR
jgi:hypothetical protein